MESHPGLLKAACMALISGGAQLPAGSDEAAAALLRVRDIRSECGKLWNGISRDEQNFLMGMRDGGDASPERDEESRVLLELKGLIWGGNGGGRIFSPIFGGYVSALESAAPPAIKTQAGPIRIDVGGEV